MAVWSSSLQRLDEANLHQHSNHRHWKELFLFSVEKAPKQRLFYEKAQQNRPCCSLSQTGIKYSSLHTHSLVPPPPPLTALTLHGGISLTQKIKECILNDCKDCLLIRLTLLYYSMPGFPLLQSQKEKGVGGAEGQKIQQWKRKERLPMPEFKKKKKKKKCGSVDLHLHYSPLTLLIANHDAALWAESSITTRLGRRCSSP